MVVRLLAGLSLLSGATLAGAQPAVNSDPEIATLAKAAETARGLKLLQPLIVRRLDRAALGVFLKRELRSEPTLGPDYGDVYRLLGVIDQRADLRTLMTDVLGDQVLGVYDDDRKELLLIRTKGAEASTNTIVHEIVHAIQDQHFDLRGRRIRPGPHQSDAGAAAISVVEGDATEAGFRDLSGRGTGAALAELFGALGQLSGGKGTRIPPYIERQMTFPYEEGMAFVKELRARGGRKLVDRAFRNPPKTTAAILDVRRYLAGNPGPLAVTLPRPVAGARRVIDTTYGAAEILALTGNRSLASGWNGGRLSLDRAGNRRILSIRLRANNAKQIGAAFRRSLPAGAKVSVAGPWVSVHIIGRRGGTS